MHALQVASICLILIPYVLSTMITERIVGGQEVDIKDVPYQLAILDKSMNAICGGALISKNYGLSAAHCFKVKQLFRARAGSSFKNAGGTVNYITTVLLHPERANSQLLYDIAILKFQKPFKLSDSIQPVKLATNDNLLKPGVEAVVSGFGLLSEDGVEPIHLRAAIIYIQDFKLCQNNYRVQFGNVLNDLQFCASTPGKKDACQGDSGGPLVIDNTLYGLVSYGPGCAVREFPGIYTNVAKYREFIQVNTGI